MTAPKMSVYVKDPSDGSARLMPVSEDILKQIEAEWNKILTHEPVFSSGKNRREYLIRFDECTTEVLQENEAEYEFRIKSDSPEAAIYDFLREMGEEYWAILEEDSHIWAIPAEDDSDEQGRMYEFKPDSSALVGKLTIDGVELECGHDPCPNSGFPHMMHIIRDGSGPDGLVCFICDLMPLCIAKETIAKALRAQEE